MATSFVTILILIDGFLQYKTIFPREFLIHVTILILIDGFLQCDSMKVEIIVYRQSQSLF